MVRIILGSIVAAIAMSILGFVFYASGLERIAHVHVGNAEAAQVQGVLAATLPKEGTYHIPGTTTPEQTVMYGQGPIATVHYNPGGFPAMDPGALIGGLVLNFVVALLIGAVLIGIDRRVPDFGSRARVVAILAVAASAYINLKQPIYQHHDWTHYFYLLIADALVLAAAGLILARWFLPNLRSAPADAPAEA